MQVLGCSLGESHPASEGSFLGHDFLYCELGGWGRTDSHCKCCADTHTNSGLHHYRFVIVLSSAAFVETH